MKESTSSELAGLLWASWITNLHHWTPGCKRNSTANQTSQILQRHFPLRIPGLVPPEHSCTEKQTDPLKNDFLCLHNNNKMCQTPTCILVYLLIDFMAFRDAIGVLDSWNLRGIKYDIWNSPNMQTAVNHNSKEYDMCNLYFTP